MVKNPLVNAGDIKDVGAIPGLGRFPGKGHGNPLQYSCMGNPWTEEPGGLQSTGSQSQTILSDQHTHLAQSVTVASTICVKSVVSSKLGSHWLC